MKKPTTIQFNEMTASGLEITSYLDTNKVIFFTEENGYIDFCKRNSTLSQANPLVIKSASFDALLALEPFKDFGVFTKTTGQRVACRIEDISFIKNAEEWRYSDEITKTAGFYSYSEIGFASSADITVKAEDVLEDIYSLFKNKIGEDSIVPAKDRYQKNFEGFVNLNHVESLSLNPIPQLGYGVILVINNRNGKEFTVDQPTFKKVLEYSSQQALLTEENATHAQEARKLTL